MEIKIYKYYDEAVHRYMELKESDIKKLYEGERFYHVKDVGVVGILYTYIPTTIVGMYYVMAYQYGGLWNFKGYAIISKKIYNQLIDESDRIDSEGALY